jgi:hypothetical protein
MKVVIFTVAENPETKQVDARLESKQISVSKHENELCELVCEKIGEAVSDFGVKHQNYKKVVAPGTLKIG